MVNHEFNLNTAFPYPRLIQAINYFFPKKEGAPDIFSRENIAKFARYAPYLGLAFIFLIIVLFLRDCLMTVPQMNPSESSATKFAFYGVIDLALGVVAIAHYGKWLFYALLAKLAKRSTDVPLLFSFFLPLQAFGTLCGVRFFLSTAIWVCNFVFTHGQ